MLPREGGEASGNAYGPLELEVIDGRVLLRATAGLANYYLLLPARLSCHFLWRVAFILNP